MRTHEDYTASLERRISELEGKLEHENKYPTEWAYERVCEALSKHKERLAEAERLLKLSIGREQERSWVLKKIEQFLESPNTDDNGLRLDGN